MNNNYFSSTNTTPSNSRRTSLKYPVGARMTKPSFAKRMKNFLFCGLYQERSTSPDRQPKEIPKSRSSSKIIIHMATDISDSSDWYTAECGTSQYTLPKRYQDLSPIGQGAFGAVIRATDKETGKDVAIKKMLRPFQSETHAKRTYRELKLLMHLNHQDAQVVQLYNVFTPEKNVNDFQTLYFVLNFVDYDLSKVIKRGKPFTEDHIKLLIYSLLRGLKFIHSAGVIHRDLKPTNIGISQNSDLTVSDHSLDTKLVKIMRGKALRVFKNLQSSIPMKFLFLNRSSILVSRVLQPVVFKLVTSLHDGGVHQKFSSIGNVMMKKLIYGLLVVLWLN
jgi:tRNA A-37 threonylcarbamoyl transferase component Bud32